MIKQRDALTYGLLVCALGILVLIVRGHREPSGAATTPAPVPSAAQFSYPFVTYIPLFLQHEQARSTASSSLGVQAAGAGLYNLSKQEPIWEYHADEPAGIASVTKLMTALLVKQHGDGAIFTLSQDDLSVDSVNKELRIGDQFTATEAIHFLLIASDNAIAHNVGRTLFASGTDAFIHAMNQTASDIGMRHTHFTDPVGLGDDTSTVSDLARFAQYMVRHQPDLLSFSRYAHLTIITEQGRTFALDNTNVLINKIPGFVGSKTGYTPEAGGSLLVVFETQQGTLASIVLGSADRFGDTSRMISWYWDSVSATMRTSGD